MPYKWVRFCWFSDALRVRGFNSRRKSIHTHTHRKHYTSSVSYYTDGCIYRTVHILRRSYIYESTCINDDFMYTMTVHHERYCRLLSNEFIRRTLKNWERKKQHTPNGQLRYRKYTERKIEREKSAHTQRANDFWINKNNAEHWYRLSSLFSHFCRTTNIFFL